MDIFRISQLLDERQKSQRSYLEFLRVASMSAGVYYLPAGAVDAQQPHNEDEIYYVVTGRASMRIGTEDHPVEPGAIVFVKAGVEHRFHSITEDLALLVFFVPAET